MYDIETAFAKTFSNWNIRLPSDAVEQKRPGKIEQSGWFITYVFNEDHMDFYAVHRMTNPRHIRIYSDGRCEGLAAPSEGYCYPGDTDQYSDEYEGKSNESC